MLPTAPIRVLIADDIPELRTLLRTTLQGRGFQLVGEAGDGRETLALAVDREPDVVVLDLGMCGIADTEQRRRALDLGAHASLDMDVDPDQLVTTLREVCGRAFGPVALPRRKGWRGWPPTNWSGSGAPWPRPRWPPPWSAPTAASSRSTPP
jgi:DNA-binding NarL/FixJ family response regulator